MMPFTIILGLGLALGQAPIPSEPTRAEPGKVESPRGEEPSAAKPRSEVASSAPGEEPSEKSTPKDESRESTLLMGCLEGTWIGNQLAENRLNVQGWIDASFTGSSARSSNLPMGTNYLANQFLLQQNWLRFERTIDTKASQPTWGFLVDAILPGSDYRFTLPRGFFDRQLTDNDGQPATYGIDLPQMYLELQCPGCLHGLNWKLGRFFTLIGTESVDTTQNLFGSNSYAFIYDPFTNTGLLGTLKISDEMTVQSAIVTGSDVWIDSAATPTYMGSIRWTGKDGKDSLAATLILGSGRYNVESQFSNPRVLDVVYKHQFSKAWNYTFNGVFGFQNDVPAIGTASWYGLVQYLSWQITDKWSQNLRLELFDDVQGSRTGFPGMYTACTAGLNYRVTSALLLRPEVRYDYNGESTPFEGQHGLLTAAFDLVFKW